MVANATAPQVNLLGNLLQERLVEDDFAAALRVEIEKGLNTKQASTFITLLMALPEREPRPTEPGLYRHPVTGETCKVQVSKKTGNPYAMRQRPSGKGWDYVPGLIRELRADLRSDAAPAPAAEPSGADALLARLQAQVVAS